MAVDVKALVTQVEDKTTQLQEHVREHEQAKRDECATRNSMDDARKALETALAALLTGLLSEYASREAVSTVCAEHLRKLGWKVHKDPCQPTRGDA